MNEDNLTKSGREWEATQRRCPPRGPITRADRLFNLFMFVAVWALIVAYSFVFFK